MNNSTLHVLNSLRGELEVKKKSLATEVEAYARLSEIYLQEATDDEYEEMIEIFDKHSEYIREYTLVQKEINRMDALIRFYLKYPRD